MMRCKFVVLTMLLAATSGAAQELPSLEKAAEKLRAATVTLRVTPPPVIADGEETTPKVSVFSAVSLGDGLVVTPLFESEGAQVRVTLPGGGQATAEPVVLDEHAGLALLKLDHAPTGLSLGDSPKAGSWVLSAAAWGGEEALVSAGIVSGVDRALPGANYPPLLQLDIRTASTSSGAGVVNPQGELLGVVVASGEPANERGWTYAIPAQQIRRVVRASQNRAPGEDGVMIIQRRRPVVGMTLTGNAEGIHVDRVVEGGPADKAGVEVGDEVVAVEGLHIRSVYQAVRPVLFKQPGDTIEYLVRQRSGERTVTIALGGGVVVQGVPKVKLSGYFQPKILVEGRPLAPPHLAEVGADSADIDRPAATTSEAQKIALLQKALDGYRSAIVQMQGQLIRQQQDRDRTQKLIEKLEQEVDSLRRQLGK